jgi:hypothetical protein
LRCYASLLIKKGRPTRRRAAALRHALLSRCELHVATLLHNGESPALAWHKASLSIDTFARRLCDHLEVCPS